MPKEITEMNGLKIIGREFHKGQKAFGDDIARIINSALLTIVYFLGVGTSWIFARLSKKEILELKIDLNAKTYWKELNLTTKPIKEYYRQF